MADVEGLKKLTFYAIDVASPFDLALNNDTDSVDKIARYTLVELHITGQGIADMWQTINGYAGKYGGKPVPASAAIPCKTVADVWSAVQSAANS